MKHFFECVFIITVLSLPEVLQYFKVHVHWCVSVLAQAVKATFDPLICPPHSMDTFATCVLDKKQHTIRERNPPLPMTPMRTQSSRVQIGTVGSEQTQKRHNRQKFIIKHIY